MVVIELSFQFAVLVTILALAEGVVGFLAYSQREEVRGQQGWGGGGRN